MVLCIEASGIWRFLCRVIYIYIYRYTYTRVYYNLVGNLWRQAHWKIKIETNERERYVADCNVAQMYVLFEIVDEATYSHKYAGAS